MGIVNNTYQFTENNETVTKTKLNNLAGPLVTEFNGNIDNDNISATASISGSKLDLSGTVVNADINAAAAIVDTKLATISTAGKVSGAALTSLANIPSGAGVIPAANVPVDTDATITTTDITTNDASTSKHGFLKKLSNIATEFMNGVGNWVAVTIDALLPSQTGNSGKFLTTNGSAASWGSLPASGGWGYVSSGAFSVTRLSATDINITYAEKYKYKVIISGYITANNSGYIDANFRVSGATATVQPGTITDLSGDPYSNVGSSPATRYWIPHSTASYPITWEIEFINRVQGNTTTSVFCIDSFGSFLNSASNGAYFGIVKGAGYATSTEGTSVPTSVGIGFNSGDGDKAQTFTGNYTVMRQMV